MENFEEKYKTLAALTIETLDTQQQFFKTRDHNLLKKSKALEQKLRDLISGKQNNQQQLSIEFLGR